MSDLTDEELDSIEASLGGPQRVAVSKSETCRMLYELRQHRAMVKRLEELAEKLESQPRDWPAIPRYAIAAELRNRMRSP